MTVIPMHVMEKMRAYVDGFHIPEIGSISHTGIGDVLVAGHFFRVLILSTYGSRHFGVTLYSCDHILGNKEVSLDVFPLPKFQSTRKTPCGDLLVAEWFRSKFHFFRLVLISV